MTSKEGLFPAGMGMTDDDLARVAGVAARGEDRALALLAAPGGADGTEAIKRVIPLHDELRAPYNLSGTLQPQLNNPRILACEAALLGGTLGRLRVLPCAFLVSPSNTAPEAQTMDIVARLDEAVDVGPFTSSPAGRVDTVYAAITLYTPGDGSRTRRIKDVTSGVPSSNVINVYREPRVQILVSPGTEGSGTPGALSADSPGSSTWYVKLAEVALQAGYTSGAALSFGSSSIFQKWERGGIRSSAAPRVRAGQGMAFTNADAGVSVEAANSSRGGEYHIVRPVFRQTAAGAIVVLDTGIDWRDRMVRVSVVRAAAHAVVAPWAVYPPPNGVNAGGRSTIVETGWTFTGRGAVVAGVPAGYFHIEGSPGAAVYLVANSGSGYPEGALIISVEPAPTDAANGGDHYTVIAEALGRDTEGQL